MVGRIWVMGPGGVEGVGDEVAFACVFRVPSDQVGFAGNRGKGPVWSRLEDLGSAEANVADERSIIVATPPFWIW
jgi:hypothetical protein